MVTVREILKPAEGWESEALIKRRTKGNKGMSLSLVAKCRGQERE